MTSTSGTPSSGSNPPPPPLFESRQAPPSSNTFDRSLAATPISIVVDKLGADIVFFNAAFTNILNSQPPPPLPHGGARQKNPRQAAQKSSWSDVASILNTLNYPPNLCRLSRIKSVFSTMTGSRSSTSILPTHAKVCSFADLLIIHYVLFAGRGMTPTENSDSSPGEEASSPLSPRRPEKVRIVQKGTMSIITLTQALSTPLTSLGTGEGERYRHATIQSIRRAKEVKV